MRRSGATWLAVGCLGTGIVLIGLPVLGVALAGATNPYGALMFVMLGLVAVGAACGIVAYRLARVWVSAFVALAIGAIGALPPFAPIFGSSAVQLSLVAVYAAALAAAQWWFVSRSVSATVYLVIAGVTAIAVVTFEAL